MLVSVSQRTGEIGLLKALGATSARIRWLFLVEAAMLSLAGALVGYALGQMGAAVIRQIYPPFPPTHRPGRCWRAWVRPW